MFKNIVVIGTGTMGASIGLAAARHEVTDDILFLDIDAGHLRGLESLAKEHGVSRKVRTGGFPAKHEGTINAADLVILATDQSAFQGLVMQAAPYMKDGACLTDIGSCKVQPKKEIEAVLREIGAVERVVYLGSHPGTGRPGCGPSHSDPAMLKSQPVFVMRPEDIAGQELRKKYQTGFQKLKNFWQGLGSRVIETTPVAHDKMFGVSSHLQNFTARALECMAATPDGKTLRPEFTAARTHMRNMTRVALGNNVKMWCAIAGHNRNYILEGAEGFRTVFNDLLVLIEERDYFRILEKVKQAHEYRKKMPDPAPRENLQGEIHDWQDRYLPVFLPKQVDEVISPMILRSVFRKKKTGDTTLGEGYDFARGTALPVLIAAASALNLKALDSHFEEFNMYEQANPSFLDGTAAMLSPPAGTARLLYEMVDYLPKIANEFMGYFDDITGYIENRDAESIAGFIGKTHMLRLASPLPRKSREENGQSDPVRPSFVINLKK